MKLKTRTRYIIYIIIITIFSIIIPGMLTNSKYFYSVNFESNVEVGNMIFKIKQKENEPTTYQIQKAEEITAKYEIINFDEDNNINETNLKYYIKITDNSGNETLPLNITVNEYNYVEYKVDDSENIIDINGNITDEQGNIIQERNLTEEENLELQKSLKNVKKGYGPINMPHDGNSKDTKEINIKVKCPENYEGNIQLQYKILLIAEGKNIKANSECNLKIKIQETNNSEEVENSQINTNQESLNNSEETEVNKTNNEIQNNLNEEIQATQNAEDIQSNSTEEAQQSKEENNQTENSTENQID